MNLDCLEFIEFFNTENVLSKETAKICKGIMSIAVGGTVASWLVHSSPDRAVRV